MTKNHHNKRCASHRNFSRNKHLVLFGVASFVWFVFRTGTKPSRIMYPCQRAALANSSILLGLSIPIWLTSALTKTKNFISKKGISIIILFIIANIVLSGSQFLENMQLAGAANPNQELNLSLAPIQASSSPTSNLYVVNGRANAHVNELINLMGSNGLLFYKSNTGGKNQGPNGLIANNDVILIKINEEWPYRGGTNTDILKELLQALVDHPEGFAGEIVVADNGQWQGNMNWPESNAEDHAQSTQDVVNTFSTLHKVSTYSWIPIRSLRVNEYLSGDDRDGYVLNDTSDPETGIFVSYPKFQTTYGTYVSFKNGIWKRTSRSRN